MGRVVTFILGVTAAGLVALSAVAKDVATSRLTIFADRDDDDDDGIADSLAASPRGAGAADVVEPKNITNLRPPQGDALRVTNAPLLGRSAPGLQGLHAGRTVVEGTEARLEVDVVEVIALDGRGERVELASSHASISRSLPASLSAEPAGDHGDLDALRWVFAGPPGAVPDTVRIVSTRPSGEALDALEGMVLRRTACPSGLAEGTECRQTPLIRATTDVIDRSHPESAARSLRAEVGGRIAVHVDGRKAQAIRVGGPRKSELGPLGRFRGRLRMRLVRLTPGGSPPVGGDEPHAVALAHEEVRTASALWGQCGIHFGWGNDVDVAVVDPPTAHLLAIGCDLGLPASGGEIAFRAGNKALKVQTAPGQTPTEVANAVALAVRKAGMKAIVSANARIGPGALRTVDVLIRKHDGSVIPLEPLEQRLSSDATLDVCLGEVDLSDGLQHFNDFDAVSGTVEERSLIKAFEDGDPATLEVFVIPNFAQSGRIGESFIYADGSSVRNAVIIDRAAIRAGARSYALAHELGHILLDMPGHPDDYGVDQPSSLMDADAADPTIFGPRRLTVADCERALRQSGPRAPVPLLEDWPLFKQKPEPRPAKAKSTK
jgi:hypothetical protein